MGEQLTMRCVELCESESRSGYTLGFPGLALISYLTSSSLVTHQILLRVNNTPNTLYITKIIIIKRYKNTDDTTNHKACMCSLTLRKNITVNVAFRI